MATKDSSKSKNAPTEVKQKLFRSNSDRVIGGVCGGLGNYFGIDPTLVRLVFAILLVFGGSGFLLYLILWLVIPSQPRNIDKDSIKNNADEIKETAQSWLGGRSKESNERGVWVGLIILLVGLYFLINNFQIFPFLDFGKFWPILLIVLGLLIFSRRKDG